jgi:hypothetical protein
MNNGAIGLVGSFLNKKNKEGKTHARSIGRVNVHMEEEEVDGHWIGISTAGVALADLFQFKDIQLNV